MEKIVYYDGDSDRYVCENEATGELFDWIDAKVSKKELNDWFRTMGNIYNADFDVDENVLKECGIYLQSSKKAIKSDYDKSDFTATPLSMKDKLLNAPMHFTFRGKPWCLEFEEKGPYRNPGVGMFLFTDKSAGAMYQLDEDEINQPVLDCLEQILQGEPVEFDDIEIVSSKKAIKSDIKVYQEISFRNFEPWSDAVDVQRRIVEEGKEDEFEAYIADCYPEGIDATKLNDILRFDTDYIYKYLGIKGDDDEIASGCHGKGKKKDKKEIKSERLFGIDKNRLGIVMQKLHQAHDAINIAVSICPDKRMKEKTKDVMDDIYSAIVYCEMIQNGDEEFIPLTSSKGEIESFKKEIKSSLEEALEKQMKERHLKLNPDGETPDLSAAVEYIEQNDDWYIGTDEEKARKWIRDTLANSDDLVTSSAIKSSSEIDDYLKDCAEYDAQRGVPIGTFFEFKSLADEDGYYVGKADYDKYLNYYDDEMKIASSKESKNIK